MTGHAAPHPDRLPVNAPPNVQLLSNGRYSVMLTDAGAGYSHWNDCAITRWQADPTCDDRGAWLYLRDIDDGATWSAGLQPTAAGADDYSVEFRPERAIIRRRDGDIVTELEVVVDGQRDAEVRRLRVQNNGSRNAPPVSAAPPSPPLIPPRPVRPIQTTNPAT